MVQSLGVVVGVDESGQSLRALDWAVRRAAARGGMLTICHVLPYELPQPPLSEMLRAEQGARGRSLMDRAVLRARQADRHLTVEERLERGHMVAVLLDMASAADEVVVGSRGTGGFPRLRIGSVGSQLAGHALCPVTVVDGRGAERAEVVIGVDGSEAGRAALDYGFRFAADNGLSVHAVHACPEPSRAGAREVVRDATAPWAVKYPDVSLAPRSRPDTRPPSSSRPRSGRRCSSWAAGATADSPACCSARSATPSCGTRSARSPLPAERLAADALRDIDRVRARLLGELSWTDR